MSDPFTDPVLFLGECHGRIRQRLDSFREIAERLADAGAIERHALEAALLFFRTSGEGHTIDEETSLFPRLLPRLRELGELAAAEQIEELIAEHREHEALFAGIAEAMAAVDPTLGTGDGLPDPDAPLVPCGTPEARRLSDALLAVVLDYERHIPIEDGFVFPLAQRVLRPAEKEAIAAEMRGRRSLGRKLLA
jgi:hemerythrin-like domain-containing protein